MTKSKVKLHRKKIDIYANISLFPSYSEVTVATRSGPYPAQMVTAVTRSSPYPDELVDHHLETTSTALNDSGVQDWPPDWAWFLPRFFLHSVTDGVLVPCRSRLWHAYGDTSFPAISSTWLHRYYLNWTELDNAITKFNNSIIKLSVKSFNCTLLTHYFPLFDTLLCSCFVTICMV